MKARLSGRWIVVTGADTDAQRMTLAEVPGNTFKPPRWLYPASPVTAWSLMKLGVDLEGDGAIALATEQVERLDRLAAVRGGDGLPADYPDDLWRHQVGAVWVASLRGGTLLDYGMRSGKTRITLEVVRSLDLVRVLVVCPLKVIDTWPEEADKHGIGVPVVPLKGGTVAQRAKRAADHAGRGVFVINYEAVWREPFGAWALKQRWDLIVFDEVHKCQSPGGKASRYLARLADTTSRRIGLSGTPVGDGPINAYGVFRVLDKGVFGNSHARFKSRYIVEKEIQPGISIPVGLQRADEFRERYNLITLKGDRDASDMPDETDSNLYADLPPAAAKAYRSMRDELLAELRRGTVTAANALVKVGKLHQLAAGHVKHEDGRTEDVHREKDALLAEVLDELGPVEPLVVFCWYKADLERIASVCSAAGRECLEISGRRDDLAAWKAGGGSVIAVQIQAGGVGVDLSRACYAVFWTACFSYPLYKQARARLLGQKRSVAFTHLVTRGTVDAGVYRALERKGEVLDDLLRAPEEVLDGA